MKNTLKISWKYNGQNEANLEKEFCDILAVMSFMEGFVEGRLTSNNYEGFTAVIKCEKQG